MKNPLAPIEGVIIQVVRMDESSGNVQYFLRARRTDIVKTNFFNDGILEYACHQTKHELSQKECIERVMFEAQYLLRFFGLKAEDIQYANMDDEDMEVVKSCRMRV